jgi:predicted lactoylglutathione lyase
MEAILANNYVLIDFENVQPKNLQLLTKHPCKVFVFIGANQTRLPRHVVVAMQALGDKAEYVEIEGSGPNALDFHIAYYVGRLSEQDPAGQFHIVSKDKGFDPLIKYLKGRKVRVRRQKDLAEIPDLRISTSAGTDEQIKRIVKNLVDRGQSRPRKVSSLQNMMNNLISEDLDQRALDVLIEEMKKRKLISVKDNKVTYKLPH